MIRGIRKAIADPRTRCEWRWLAARRFGRGFQKWLQPTYRALDWSSDPWFADFVQSFGEVDNPHSANRWNLYQLARSVADIPGDTAECGVFQGAGSYLICSASHAVGRKHFAFDSFAGLPTPSPRDGAFWRHGDFAWPMEAAQARLQQFNVSWHPGWIPNRFHEVGDRRFAFVHIDVDLEQPTRDSVEFFYPRVNPGGILLCDDYGFAACPGATRAIDEFLAHKPEKIVALSSGGGFIVKRQSTGSNNV